MADFNTQTEEQIINELIPYGYTHLETTNDSSPLVMYFEDALNGVLKLIVDTTSQVQVYGYYPETCWREQPEVLSLSEVSDLASLDALLIPAYTYIDPMIIRTENLTEIDDRTVLVPVGPAYYSSTEFQEPLTPFTVHLVSELPSPYRERDLIWVPVTFLDPEWALEYNNSVIVNTADVVSNAYGDFIVVLPE